MQNWQINNSIMEMEQILSDSVTSHDICDGPLLLVNVYKILINLLVHKIVKILEL